MHPTQPASCNVVYAFLMCETSRKDDWKNTNVSRTPMCYMWIVESNHETDQFGSQIWCSIFPLLRTTMKISLNSSVCLQYIYNCFQKSILLCLKLVHQNDLFHKYSQRLKWFDSNRVRRDEIKCIRVNRCVCVCALHGVYLNAMRTIVASYSLLYKSLCSKHLLHTSLLKHCFSKENHSLTHTITRTHVRFAPYPTVAYRQIPLEWREFLYAHPYTHTHTLI